MSRLLRDATRASGAPIKPNQPKLDEADPFDFPEEPPKRQQEYQPMQEKRTALPDTLESSFDPHQFERNFLKELGEFSNLESIVPDDISTFLQFDQFKAAPASELKLVVCVERQKLNAQLQETLSQLRNLERDAESAVTLQKDKSTVISMLYERKDMQNKVALICKRKRELLAVSETIDMLEIFGELSKDYSSFQKTAGGFLSAQHVDSPITEPDPLLSLSLVYNKAHYKTNGFKIDREPIHDYMAIEFPSDDGRGLRQRIESEYENLLRNAGR